MKLDFRQRLLATTLMVGAGLLATPAFAQDAPAQDVPNTSGPLVAEPPASMEAQPSQEAPAPEEAASKDIVVTGTRIPSANLESVAPVTVVSAQDIKLQGTTKVEDLLNSLPSVFAAQASTISNGADGTATVDLRGLGAKRTLVLVNGRRLTPGSPTSGGPADINIIPSSIVKRIEVLTGGASSTYGADAVSGVVNFIMDTEFTGIRFDGQYSVYQHSNRDRNLGSGKSMYDILNARIAQGLDGYGYPTGSVVDGGAFDGTISIGSNFADDKGHATVYLGYRNVNPVLQARRDYSACTIQNSAAGVPQCGGSLTNQFGNGFYYVTGTSTIYNVAGDKRGVGPRYNFAPTNYYQRPDERYTAGLFANYDISPAIQPYVEFMFMSDRSVAQIAPSGDFGNTLTVNCDNPLLTANEITELCGAANLINGFVGNYPLASGNPINTGAPGSGTPGHAAPPIDFFDPLTGNTYNKGFFQLLRRNVEGGPRQQDTKFNTFRGVLGSKGDLGKVWSYDAYYQYGRVNYDQTYRNEFSTRRLNNALDVVTDTRANSPTFGQPVCRSVTDGTDPNCVPYDVYNNNVSQAAVNYLAATGLQNGQTSEQIAHADFTGLLGEYGIKFPWAEDGVAVNLGTEYRKESLELDVDNAFATGDLTGQGAPTLPIKGNYRVIEFFGEAQLPIVQHSFIYDLELTAGYRRSYYQTSSGGKYDTNTYKIGFEFAPIQDVRFRGSYNRAVRAPNIQELFATQFVGLDGSEDPCADKVITATDYGCIAQGMVPTQKTPGNPAGQYNGLLGGNPNLQPETATTKTVGVVLQPRFLPRFALTIDWFDIKVKDAIQGFGADAILTDCGNATATFTPASCALIHRDVAGSLWLSSNGFVTDLPHNIGGLETKGFEINSSYSRKLGNIGTLSSSMVGTYLTKFSTDNGLTPVYDCVGLYGSTCGTPAPHWRSKSRLTLTMPSGIGVSVQARYIGKVKADSLSSNPSLVAADAVFGPGDHVKAQTYFDLATTYTIGDHYNLRLGVNNIFDKMPPMTTSGSAVVGGSNQCPTGPCNGNTWPATYDALGRYLYAGITLDF
jgi:iron complex outermembrane receptor protein